MADRPARPPVRLQYLMWDGTDPVDSKALARGLQTGFRCINLLDDSPKTEPGVFGSPRIFQPCGTKGKDASARLWVLGMFVLPNAFLTNTVHDNKGGDFPAILQYSGHGMPGYMFAESGVLIATPRPMELTSSGPPAGIVWNFADLRWDNPSTKVVIFSACRQLAGIPLQALWAKRMRGPANRVHTILSYRETAPAASTSAGINNAFVAQLRAGKTFIEAWRAAHGGSLRSRWAALAYRSAVQDKMKDWVKSGSLPVEPVVDENILYFDEDTRSGCVVTDPKPDFDMTMSFLGPPATGSTVPPAFQTGNLVPPWSVLPTGTLVSLQIKFLPSSFQDHDKLWLGIVQVRTDYHKPFDIENLIRFQDHENVMISGKVDVLGRLHDESAGWIADSYSDLYEIQIARAGMPFASLDAAFTQLNIPMFIGKNPKNDGYPILYFNLRVERGAKEFGVPTIFDPIAKIAVPSQEDLIDQPQFCHFLIFP